jgi:hypothetical protein
MELDNAAHLAPINVTEADKSPLTNDDLSLPPTPQTTTEAFQTTYVVAADQETAVVLEGQMYVDAAHYAESGTYGRAHCSTSVIESHKEVDVISASITRSAILDYLENRCVPLTSHDPISHNLHHHSVKPAISTMIPTMTLSTVSVDERNSES